MKFYCTAGRGTEIFLAREIRNLWGDAEVSVTDGKVYVELKSQASNPSKILSLRAAERVFVQVLHKDTKSLDRRGLLHVLLRELIQRELLADCLTVWRSTTLDTDTGKSVAQSGNDEGPVCDSRQTVTQSDNDEGPVNDSRKTVAQSGNDEGPVCDSRQTVAQSGNDEGPVCDSRQTVTQSDNDEGPVNDSRKTVAQSGNDEGPVCDSGQTVAQSDNNKGPVNDIADHGPPAKKMKFGSGCDSCPTFRVSCKVSGSARRKLDPQRTSRQVGTAVSKLMEWNLDLRRPELEICIHANDDHLIIGIPLTRVPISKRTFIRHCGLRAPIAWSMIHLLNIQPGDVIVDPMCGKATILLEAVHCFKNAVYIGGDSDIKQLQLAKENLQFSGDQSNIQLLMADCTEFPFGDETVDKIVTDAPFGHKFTTQQDIRQFYRDMLKEFHRLLKPSGCVVLLTSAELKQFISEILLDRTSLDQSSCSNPSNVQLSGKLNVNNETADKPIAQTDACGSSPTHVDEDIQKTRIDRSSKGKDLPSYENGEPCKVEGRNESPEDLSRSVTGSLCQGFQMTENHYVKMGETHAYICVIHKLIK